MTKMLYRTLLCLISFNFKLTKCNPDIDNLADFMRRLRLNHNYSCGKLLVKDAHDFKNGMLPTLLKNGAVSKVENFTSKENYSGSKCLTFKLTQDNLSGNETENIHLFNGLKISFLINESQFYIVHADDGGFHMKKRELKGKQF